MSHVDGGRRGLAGLAGLALVLTACASGHPSAPPRHRKRYRERRLAARICLVSRYLTS